MSLIRNGYAVSTRRGFLGALFSALLALALFDSGAIAAQEVNQIKLTEKHIQGFMAASKDMAKLYDGANADQPDPTASGDRCAGATPGNAVAQRPGTRGERELGDFLRGRRSDAAERLQAPDGGSAAVALGERRIPVRQEGS